MLIRITSASKGLAEYLEKGKKAGRNFTRDELDERRHIMGDINDFRAAVEHTNDTRDWNSHYLHITGGLTLNEQDLSEEKIEAITKEIIEFYTMGYNLEDVSFHAEYHAPKIQSIEADGKRHHH